MKGRTPLRKYSKDHLIVDYAFEELDQCTFAIRGPIPSESSRKKRIVCLGSAATFGRFVEKPYPALLAERLGADVINCGFGGARFETYLKEPAIIDLCRQSHLVVLEVMSARSYESDLLTPRDHLGKVGTVGSNFVGLFYSGKQPKPVKRGLYKWAWRNLDTDTLFEIRRQILDRYRQDAVALMAQVGCPVILLWFSQRSMDSPPRDAAGYTAWMGSFPHFVDAETVHSIAAQALDLVDVTSKAGIPSVLLSRETGLPIAGLNKREAASDERHLNTYYPSPEMHVQAAQALADRIAPILERL